MTESAPSTPTTWQVTGQQETTEQAINGGFVSGRRVYFTTGNGNGGSVFVPDTMYDADTVRRMVSAAAANVDAIGSLRG